MLNYPITLTPDTNGTFLVGFTDFPEANAVGEDTDDARAQAVDALEAVLEIYFDERRPVPLPSAPAEGQLVVALPALSTAKVLIWNEMHARNLRKADMARLMSVHTPQIDRLFDLGHSSKIEFVEQAAKVLGKSLNVSLA